MRLVVQTRTRLSAPLVHALARALTSFVRSMQSAWPIKALEPLRSTRWPAAGPTDDLAVARSSAVAYGCAPRRGHQLFPAAPSQLRCLPGLRLHSQGSGRTTAARSRSRLVSRWQSTTGSRFQSSRAARPALTASTIVTRG